VGFLCVLAPLREEKEDSIMHHRTVHDTPMGKTVMRWLALIIFRFTGWKPAGKNLASPDTSS